MFENPTAGPDKEKLLPEFVLDNLPKLKDEIAAITDEEALFGYLYDLYNTVNEQMDDWQEYHKDRLPEATSQEATEAQISVDIQKAYIAANNIKNGNRHLVDLNEFDNFIGVRDKLEELMTKQS